MCLSAHIPLPENTDWNCERVGCFQSRRGRVTGQKHELSSGNCQLIRGDRCITLEQGTKTFFSFARIPFCWHKVLENSHTQSGWWDYRGISEN